MEQPKQKQTKDAHKEIDVQLSELEERVDRLRALYEQYFMGYEKLEPSVPRKDVDRRFMLLRKTQLRNTAVRFRFNVITQKFNTYAMYWTRVCRQIEEGTFKRHIQKAKRRFGDDATPRKPGVREEEESSIDVELGDFEDGDYDLDSILREADAAADAYGNAASDTLPPAPPSDKPPTLSQPHTQPLAFRPAGPALRPRTSTEPLRTLAPMDETPASIPSSTSFALRGGRESIGVPESRPMRAAALPPGAKPKILVRRGDGAPDSTSSQVNASLAPPESERSPAARPRAPSFVADSERAIPSIRARAPSFVADSERTPTPSVPRPPAPSASSIRPSPGMTTPPGMGSGLSGTTPQAYRPAQRPASMESTGRIVARPSTGVNKVPGASIEDTAMSRVAPPPAPMTPRPIPAPPSSRQPTSPMRVAPKVPSEARIPTEGGGGALATPTPTRRPPPALPSAGKTAKKH